ncbi:claudin-10-like isoform X2 [Boleophthalmus pectinirostris]|uniref:claudin-10-like isoform X2 n=1 Tax=Boleophthalmus pectinirostris TaxID=150288 RepID=UPI002431B3A6|nr:claudin-10-like isoform X2 [Boleophthalmus pectinirostris]
MSGLQILAFLSGLAGLGASFAATVSNEWRATSRASSVITATWVLQGLWNNCAGNAIGALHCRPHHTILKLEGYIQACRGLMIAAVCLGFFGSIFALVGMKCTKIGGSDQNKARIACLAGVSFILSAYVQGVRGLLMCGLTIAFFAVVLCFVGMECTYIGGSEAVKDKLVLVGAVFHFVGGVSDICAYCLYINRVARTSFAASLAPGVLRYDLGPPIFLGLVGCFLIYLGAVLYAVTVYRVIFPKREVINVYGTNTYAAPRYRGKSLYTGYYKPSRHSERYPVFPLPDAYTVVPTRKSVVSSARSVVTQSRKSRVSSSDSRASSISGISSVTKTTATNSYV